MRIPTNIPPATRRLLAEFSSFQERAESTDGYQMARGEVPSLDEPFPEYTFRWGMVRDEGSGSGGGTGSGSGNSINSNGAPHAWDEIERNNTMPGEYQLKPNGITGELPDYSKDGNDAVNLLKNTAWDLSGTQWDAGTIFLAMMVIPGEWWIVYAVEGSGSGSGGSTMTITCGDGSQQQVSINGNQITVHD